MNSEAFPVKHHGAAGFLFDRESPFSPFYLEDALASKSQTHLLSPASFSSSTSAIRSEHRYCLTKGKGNGRPFLTLLVSSRSPKPKLLPLFIGKDSISGTVELDLEKPETIREVKVTVCGFSASPLQSTYRQVSSRARQLFTPENCIPFLKYRKS